MNPAPDKLRRTGRTTRMLEHAKQLAREGRTVWVLSDSEDSTRRLRWMCGGPYPGVEFRTIHRPHQFNWIKMRPNLADEGYIFLVDHYAIETQFSRMLKMLHAYDEPPSVPAPHNGKRKILTT